MPNNFHQPAHGFGPEPRVVGVSFAPNGTSDPLKTSNKGPPGWRAFTTSYAATGAFSVVFSPDFAPPADATFVLSAQADALADYFEVMQVGAYNPATYTLVVQTKQGASGVAPAAAAGTRVHIGILFNDSTGG